jgi:malonyl-CoA O-methyltransferase
MLLSVVLTTGKRICDGIQSDNKVNSIQSLPDKTRIARSFGLAAEKYDQYAHLQRDIGDKLFAGFSAENAKDILDLGSGTGYCASKLSLENPFATVISMDLAEAMLHFAKQGRQLDQDELNQSWLCGDAEHLPFSHDSFDLVVSNLTIQWCANPHQVFKELFRVMKPGAEAWVSTFAEKTLVELKESWATIDSYRHVNNFLSCDSILQSLNAQPFSAINHFHSQEIYFYDSLGSLTGELKGIGAHNQNAGQASGLTGKTKLRKLKQDFEKKNIPGKGIPVTYDLVLLHLVK